jgi:hypothetical protein
MTWDGQGGRATPPEIVAQKRQHGVRESATTRLSRNPDDFALVTYSVALGRDASAGEKRRAPRRRTRLRAGKILDRANRFVVDATILDRSCAGLRLRIARDVALPDIFHFYDDESETIFVARIAWRNQALVGARRGPGVSATLRQLMALRGKYYGVRD